MPGRDPWRNRKIVRGVAAIDMAFAVILIYLYIWDTLRLTKHEDVDLLTDGPTSETLQPGEKLIITALKLSCAFFVNIVQFLMAYQLFYAVKEGHQESQTSISKATFWQCYSNIMFLLLIIKLVMLLFFGTGDGTGRKILFGIMCVTEIIFKAVGMFFVKEFIDDLKSAYVAPMPRVKTFSLFTASGKRVINPEQDQTPTQV